jgi:hypothetical protein
MIRGMKGCSNSSPIPHIPYQTDADKPSTLHQLQRPVFVLGQFPDQVDTIRGLPKKSALY